jgi:hypothetical protein
VRNISLVDGLSLKKIPNMKKLLLLMMVCTIISSVTLTGCSNPVPTPTIESRIVGKWIMKSAIGTYSQNGGAPYTLSTTFTASDFFNFKADGTISISETGKTYNGKWKVDANRVYISETNYLDYAAGLDIKVLTANDFQLYYNEIKPIATSEQTLNLAR